MLRRTLVSDVSISAQRAAKRPIKGRDFSPVNKNVMPWAFFHLSLVFLLSSALLFYYVIPASEPVSQPYPNTVILCPFYIVILRLFFIPSFSGLTGESQPNHFAEIFVSSTKMTFSLYAITLRFFLITSSRPLSRDLSRFSKATATFQPFHQSRLAHAKAQDVPQRVCLSFQNNP